MRLLPSDIQLDILSLWVTDNDCGSGMLAVLSALDVALPRADRPAFHSLLTQLPPITKWKRENAIRFNDNVLKWLCSRRVQLQVLMLRRGRASISLKGALKKRWSKIVKYFHPSTATLPSVEVVHIVDSLALNEGDMAQILRMCPNLTQLDCWKNHISLTAKLLSHTPKLTSLTLSGNVCPLQTIQAVGSQLQVFRCSSRCSTDAAILIAEIGKQCPLLKALEFCSFHDSPPDLINNALPRACPLLEEVVWQANYCLHHQDILSIMLDLPHIRRLTLEDIYSGERCFEVFADLLEKARGLDFLEVCWNRYSRSDGLLHLADYEQLPADLLTRIINACAGVTDFKMTLCLEHDAAMAIASTIAGQLKTAHVEADSSLPLEIFLRSCSPSLKALTVVDASLTNAVIQMVALHAGQLEYLSFSVRQIWHTDADMNFLFVHSSALQAICDQRLRLKELHLQYGVQAADVEAFKDRVRALQLLPVPVVSVGRRYSCR